MTKSIAVWIGSAFLLFAFSQQSFSQTMSFGNSVAGWAQACGNDVEASCKGVRPGSNRLAACLASKASQSCKNATAAFKVSMDARFAAQAQAPRTCGNDAKRLCSGIKQGRARLLRCLMRKENFRAASRPCKNALQAAGWLDNISKAN